eukprot:939208_1
MQQYWISQRTSTTSLILTLELWHCYIIQSYFYKRHRKLSIIATLLDFSANVNNMFDAYAGIMALIHHSILFLQKTSCISSEKQSINQLNNKTSTTLDFSTKVNNKFDP